MDNLFSNDELTRIVKDSKMSLINYLRVLQLKNYLKNWPMSD